MTTTLQASLLDYVGEINVKSFGAIGDDTSHPLSETYATLAAAQVDFPAAIALSDEKDWCAWQAAADYIYTRDASDRNWACGKIVAGGQYIVNRTITFNAVAIDIEGTNPAQRSYNGSATSITYNGSNGTVDAPVYIFDFYVQDEFAAAPPGRLKNTAYTHIKPTIKNIVFFGKNASLFTLTSSVSGFISGIRIRRALFVKIEACSFGGCLYDGITITDIQLFMIITRCWFYGVHRDGLAVHAYYADFSTTTWIYNNEFGLVGRYAMILDLSGGIEAFPIVRDNSFEHTLDSYFVANPEWFVQGLVSSTCFIGCGNMLFDGNRYEAATDYTAGYWADVHLIDCNGATIQNSNFRNLAHTAKAATPRTAAASTYLTANGHLDITNERNYHLGTAGNGATAGSDNITVRKVFNMRKMFLGADNGLSTSGQHLMEQMGGTTILSIPSTAGTYATIVQPRATAKPTIPALFNLIFSDATINDGKGQRIYNRYSQKTLCGDYQMVSGVNAFGAWAALTAYVATMTGEQLTSLRSPLTENGFFYACTTAGTSGASEPAWPTTVGNTVVDGTVTWTCVGTCAIAAEDTLYEWQTNAKRNRNVDDSTSTISGTFAVGDKVWYRTPVVGGAVGKVCVTAGTPGTFQEFGGAVIPAAYVVSSANVNAQTGTTYTLVAADNGKTLTLSNGSAITLTVPAGLGAGFACTLIQVSGGQVTVTASGTTVNSSASLVKLTGQHAVASLFAYAANTFNLAGNLSA